MATKLAAPPTRPRPYRDFLTPALHRKFTSASLLALGLCYVEAIWMGEWDYFWQWFPLGMTGIRTLLLFVCSIVIFVLRVSRTHVGTRTTTSPFETFYKNLFSPGPYLTFFWYTISAFLFSEVYLFSTPADAKMGRLIYGRMHERARLNERPVYFRTMFLVLAFTQSLIHLVSDRDRVPYPLRSTPVKGGENKPAAVDPPLTQFYQSLFTLVLNAVFASLALTFPGTAVYLVFFRSWAWNKHFTFTRYIHFLPAAQRAHPTGMVPIIDLVGRLLAESFLLMFLWEFTNAAYSAYISQDPLKKGKSLTDDSKDPNGSLIIGMRSKKGFAKATAYRELALITTHFPVRRQSIYAELERVGGSSWTQIQALCFTEIASLLGRIDSFNNPAPPQAAQAPAQIPGRKPIAAPLNSSDALYIKPVPPKTQTSKAATFIGEVARTHGNTPGATPLRNAALYCSQKLLTEARREQLTSATFLSQAETWMVKIVRSPLGHPFRHPFTRRANAVVFGGSGEYSSACVVINAVDALTNLTTNSLTEDKYAQVSKSVPQIIRFYAAAIQGLESFVAGLQPHWSDVGGKERVGDVDTLLTALKQGLESVFGVFGEYLDGLGMGSSEVKQYKMLLGRRGKEMEMIE